MYVLSYLADFLKWYMPAMCFDMPVLIYVLLCVCCMFRKNSKTADTDSYQTDIILYGAQLQTSRQAAMYMY